MGNKKGGTAHSMAGNEILRLLKDVRPFHGTDDFVGKMKPLIEKLEGRAYDRDDAVFYQNYLKLMFERYVSGKENIEYLTAIFCAEDMHSGSILKERREHFQNEHKNCPDAAYAPWMLGELSDRSVGTWEDKLLGRLGDKLAGELKGGNHLGLADIILGQEQLEPVPLQQDTSTGSPYPFHNLPYPNPLFTGRKEIMEKIAHNFQTDDSHIQILSGMPGIGKTQIAKQFAYSHMSDYDVIDYIVDDGIDDTKISDFLSGVDVEVGEKDIATVFRSFFEQYNGRWLLIFDNIDFFDEDMVDVLDSYLPKQRRNGNVIITTRCHKPFYGIMPIQVPVFTDMEAQDFLKKAAGRQDEDILALLTARLGYHPLALAYVASFVAQTPGITYADCYKNLAKKGIRWLDADDSIQQDGYKESVYKSISNALGSFSNCIEKNHKADMIEAFLKFAAYLPAGWIDLDLMADAAAWLPLEISGIDNEEYRLRLLRLLVSHSLFQIVETEGRHILRMHPLLQEVVDDKLSKDRLYWIASVHNFYRYVCSAEKEEKYADSIRHLAGACLRIGYYTEAILAKMNPRHFSQEEKDKLERILMGEIYYNSKDEEGAVTFLREMIEKGVPSHSVNFFGSTIFSDSRYPALKNDEGIPGVGYPPAVTNE